MCINDGGDGRSSSESSWLITGPSLRPSDTNGPLSNSVYNYHSIMRSKRGRVCVFACVCVRACKSKLYLRVYRLQVWQTAHWMYQLSTSENSPAVVELYVKIWGTSTSLRVRGDILCMFTLLQNIWINYESFLYVKLPWTYQITNIHSISLKGQRACMTFTCRGISESYIWAQQKCHTGRFVR